MAATAHTRRHGQFTTVNVTVWLEPEGGCAESPAPNIPVNVPVTFAVPLNAPVLAFKLIATQELELKLK